ncbi:uncharacterized protein BDV17DRAFT_288240 [Aspergillus undulatus]|uniref:uncharacterized protein n=1 Tax=Aspergillus undulatus TaxID=1810928 RepID=UPI003CCDA7CD
MEPASLALAVVSVVEICFKYGNKLSILCRQYRTLDTELEEILLTIQASWLKMDVQLKSLKALCHSLDSPLLILYHDALTRLQEKLGKASECFQVLQARAGIAFKVHQKLKVVYLRRELAQTVSDLEKWQRRFDPSWYLITRMAGTDVDRQLANANSRSGESASTSISPPMRLARMRESIQQISSSQNTTNLSRSIFKDSEIVGGQIERIEGTDAFLSKYRNTTRRILLDPANVPLVGQPGTLQTLTPTTTPAAAAATARANARDLANLLQHIDPTTFNLLRCNGVIEMPTTDGTKDQEPGLGSQSRFYLLFEVPDNLSAPQPLRTLLKDTPRCSLTQRIQLAKQLARSVMFVHAAGFVHKNIRPETVLVFREGNDEKDASDRVDHSIGPSFLIGFEKIRKAEGRTDKFGDLDWARNLYRHPSRQGLHPEDIFEMRHDIYSLGVCLLEIALWQSFVEVELDLENREPPLFIPWSGLEVSTALAGNEKDQRLGAFAIKDRLVALCKEVLPSLVGEKYSAVTIACLCCLDASEDNPFSDDKSLQGKDGIMVGVRYIENVLLKLEELVI